MIDINAVNDVFMLSKIRFSAMSVDANALESDKKCFEAINFKMTVVLSGDC